MRALGCLDLILDVFRIVAGICPQAIVSTEVVNKSVAISAAAVKRWVELFTRIPTLTEPSFS